MSKASLFSIVHASLTSLVPTAVLAGTLHVPTDYPTIQGAIDASTAGDVVLVAPGLYPEFQVRSPEGTPRAANIFLKDGVTLQSEGGARATVIDVGAVSGPRPTGALGYSLSTGPTRLEGFTFRGSSLPRVGLVLTHCTDALVSDCVFEDFLSESASGAGAYVIGNATLDRCTFLRCSAPSFGALYHELGDIALTDCIFRECDDGAVGFHGTPSGPCSQSIATCSFTDNYGGGLAIDYACANVRECLFERNFTTYYERGAVGIMGGTATIEKCAFIDNGSSDWGSALNCADYCTIRSNTFLGNYGDQSYWQNIGIISLYNGLPTFENNIVMDTYRALILWADASIQRSCNVYYLYWSLGVPLVPQDRTVNPQFCDVENNDLTLRADSPCLPDDPFGCGLIGAFDLGCGVVSVKASSWGAIKAAYR